MKRIAGRGSAIQALVYVQGQLWQALQDGQVESVDQLEPVSIQLDDSPIGLVCQQQQLWFWGRQQIIRLDPSGKILQQQPAWPCHSLCSRGGRVWTAGEHEICSYRLAPEGWEQVSRFSQLPGTCWSFDVSQDGSRFLRVWPAEGNRWQVGLYDSATGQLLSQFKRGTLWLQAVFAPDDFTLMVSGWLPQQVTALSHSGGACSRRHHLHTCGWSGPIYHFDERVVVVTQTGLQTYGHNSFPAGQPEYSWGQDYQPGPGLVIPAHAEQFNHRWHKRYSEYDRCSVTAVASQSGQVALGHLDGSVAIHDLFESSLGQTSTPIRAWGSGPEGLALLNPREKTLLEISLTGAEATRATPLPLDDYWPPGAGEWGQLHLSREDRVILSDRYGLQAFDLKSRRLLWKHEPSQWSPSTQLLAWKNRLYPDQPGRGLFWIDQTDGSQHRSRLDWAHPQRLRLYPLGQKFLLQTQTGALNQWSFYEPESERCSPLNLDPSWSLAKISSCGSYLTLSRHQVPHDQFGSVLLLNSEGLEAGRWELPWCTQIQAEPAVRMLFAVSREQLLVYDFSASLLQRLRGHGGPVHWFQVDCSARCLLSLDEYGWIRRWPLAERPRPGEIITDLARIRQLRLQLEAQPAARILISACLAGQNVRYDGQHCQLKSLDQLVLSGQAIPICPEILGGLPIPRAPSEIVEGDGADVLAGSARVQTADGLDLSRQFRAGARQALEIGRDSGGPILFAVLKSKSPSCGSGQIYDGQFAGQLRPGLGVATACFLQAGIHVVSSDLWAQASLEAEAEPTSNRKS